MSARAVLIRFLSHTRWWKSYILKEQETKYCPVQCKN